LLAGVDDPGLARAGGGAARLDENACLPPAGPRSEFVVLLKHQPRVAPGSLGRFDLQLSGHSHRGQIFPFVAVIASIYRHFSGLYELGDGSWLYVSRGTGTWGPPLRFLSPPEVAAVTLHPGRGNSNHQDTEDTKKKLLEP
jgi:predicted MPP superfamily phosphohydrolase